MTQAASVLNLTVTAAGAIARGRAVTFAGAQAAPSKPTGYAKVLGIARLAASAAGDLVTVTITGTAIAESGGAFALGDALEVDNQGRLVRMSRFGGGQTHVADALQASAAAGSFVEVLLRR